MNTRTLAARKRIALVAHDNMKDEIIEWDIYNKTALSRHTLYATGTKPNTRIVFFIGNFLSNV